MRSNGFSPKSHKWFGTFLYIVHAACILKWMYSFEFIYENTDYQLTTTVTHCRYFWCCCCCCTFPKWMQFFAILILQILFLWHKGSECTYKFMQIIRDFSDDDGSGNRKTSHRNVIIIGWISRNDFDFQQRKSQKHIQSCVCCVW